jgi:large subunit ribosomal protein L25
LTIGETKTNAVVKEMQFHPISGDTLHIDFLAVDENKPVIVEIPVQLNGLAEGVKAGGKLVQRMRKMKVQGIYTAFPDRINIDVTTLGLGKKVAVADVQIEGLKMVNPADACVAEVKATRQSKQG